MPHLRLEYTKNIEEKIEPPLFTKLHQLLNRIAGIKEENCKSRAIELNQYYIGKSGTNLAFIHLDLRILEGRDTEIKQQIGNESLQLLTNYFSDSFAKLQLQITVEVGEIQKSCYFKNQSDL